MGFLYALCVLRLLDFLCVYMLAIIPTGIVRSSVTKLDIFCYIY